MFICKHLTSLSFKVSKVRDFMATFKDVKKYKIVIYNCTLGTFTY